MARVTTEFDIELAKWQAKIAQIKADMKSAKQTAVNTNLTDALVGGGTGSGGGRGGQRAGMLAMQVQDIAVQAQMGVSSLQILAQQGSQVASIFGSGGAILGGVVALGGALVMAGMKGSEAFKELLEGAKGVREELDQLQMGGAGVDDLIRGLERLEKSTEDLQKARDNLQGFKAAAMTALGLLSGGPGMGQKKLALDDEMARQEAERLEGEMKLLEASSKQVEIANLRARGLDEQAEALERQLALEKDLAKIRASGLDQPTKDRLIENRMAIETAGDERRAKDKADKEAKEQKDEEDRRIQEEDAAQDRRIDEQKQRQENIDRMQKQLEEGRIEMLPDDQKLAEYERKLKEAQERASSASNFGDEEGRLKAELEAQEMQRKIGALQVSAPDKAETVTTARTPGSVAGAMNLLFGRSANDLILDETKQQSEALKENNRILTRIETLLKRPPSMGGGQDAFPEVFAP